MGFSNSVILNYPVNEVFTVFIRVAKRDFPKFNENNAIGCKVIKNVGAYSVKSAKLEVEITDFKKDEIYQITSKGSSVIYISRYKFEELSEDSTRLTLFEEDKKVGFFPWFNAIIQTIAFKGRVRRRFEIFAEGLETELKLHREKLSKNSKSRVEEESKIKARSEAQAAKEAARKAKEEALEAKRVAEKAIAEAKAAQEEAEKAAKDAEAKANDYDLEDEVVSDIID